MNDLNRDTARLAPLLAQLALAYRHRGDEIPAVLREAGTLGERHIGVLIVLAMSGPLSVSDLARRREMTVAHASLVVGELAKAGLVDREHDPRDRRRILVSTSEKARGAIGEMRRRNAGPVMAFLRELDERQTKEFIGHLARLLAHLRDEVPPQEAPPDPDDDHDDREAAERPAAVGDPTAEGGTGASPRSAPTRTRRS